VESKVRLEDFGVETTLPPRARVPRVATFFALYPETLGLEPGTTFCIALGQPVRGFNRTAMHVMEGQQPFWLDPKLSGFLAVSVRFHRGARDRNIFDEREEMLMSIVEVVTGNSFPEFASAPPDALPDETKAVAKPLKTRLLNEYHDRLGGAWNPQGSKDVAAWLRDVRQIRNRVAHAGILA
jgi:hypothetical protein